ERTSPGVRHDPGNACATTVARAGHHLAGCQTPLRSRDTFVTIDRLCVSTSTTAVRPARRIGTAAAESRAAAHVASARGRPGAGRRFRALRLREAACLVDLVGRRDQP